jgi:predicted AlkP superfamily phosphohydrolase/phosphomutase
MVYFGGFDTICHAFWQYRFPEQFPDPPSQEDISRLGPVIDQYLEFLDGRIGRLISSFPVPPNVLIVSDHGHEANHDYPLWKGWHSATGIFIAAGPDVPFRTDSLAVSYYDIVPTVLDLEGLATPAGVSGRSLVK